MDSWGKAIKLKRQPSRIAPTHVKGEPGPVHKASGPSEAKQCEATDSNDNNFTSKKSGSGPKYVSAHTSIFDELCVREVDPRLMELLF